MGAMDRERSLVLQLQTVDADVDCLGRVLQEEGRVESYHLDPDGRLRLRYDLRCTGYRQIRAALAAAGIRVYCRFCDAFVGPLLGLLEDNLQQQHRLLAPWTGVLQYAYVCFHTRRSPVSSDRKPQGEHRQGDSISGSRGN